MKNGVITISREYGSGGRMVGREVAKRLGINFYDEEIIDQVATQTGLAKEYIKEQGEYSPSTSLFSYGLIGRTYTGISANDYIINAQREIILKAAKSSACVIVGRAADYILKDREDTIHTFICANMETRVKRVKEEYKESSHNFEKMIKERDKKRRINYEYYTDRKWGKVYNYDICLNTSRISLDKCVDVIAKLYNNL